MEQTYRELLSSLHCSEFGAPRSRIQSDLFITGRRWLLSQQFVLPQPCAFAHRVFHDAVFQRVEADHHQPSTRLQQLRRCLKQPPQVVQFAVHEYSESLKGPRRGMNSAFSLIHWPGRG